MTLELRSTQKVPKDMHETLPASALASHIQVPGMGLACPDTQGASLNGESPPGHVSPLPEILECSAFSRQSPEAGLCIPQLQPMTSLHLPAIHTFSVSHTNVAMCTCTFSVPILSPSASLHPHLLLLSLPAPLFLSPSLSTPHGSPTPVSSISPIFPPPSLLPLCLPNVSVHLYVPHMCTLSYIHAFTHTHSVTIKFANLRCC